MGTRWIKEEEEEEDTSGNTDYAVGVAIYW